MEILRAALVRSFTAVNMDSITFVDLILQQRLFGKSK
jgi:hypothetical protein